MSSRVFWTGVLVFKLLVSPTYLGRTHISHGKGNPPNSRRIIYQRALFPWLWWYCLAVRTMYSTIFGIQALLSLYSSRLRRVKHSRLERRYHYYYCNYSPTTPVDLFSLSKLVKNATNTTKAPIREIRPLLVARTQVQPGTPPLPLFFSPWVCSQIVVVIYSPLLRHSDTRVKGNDGKRTKWVVASSEKLAKGPAICRMY